MLITINAVTINPVKTYKVAEVSYVRDGKENATKVFSFGGSVEAFKQLEALKSFPVDVNVQLVKEKGYWNWKAIELGASGNEAPKAAAVGGRVTGSNYETPEERAKRQIYIVRQSSISSAIALAEINAKAKPSVEEVLEVAKQFEEYVLNTNVEPN